jgi:hypothetical protein
MEKAVNFLVRVEGMRARALPAVECGDPVKRTIARDASVLRAARS